MNFFYDNGYHFTHLDFATYEATFLHYWKSETFSF